MTALCERGVTRHGQLAASNRQQQALASDRFGGSLLRSGLTRPQGTAPLAKPQHFATSQKIGALALLPTVRAAAADTLAFADGFSCHEQIEQGTGHGTLHLARRVRN